VFPRLAEQYRSVVDDLVLSLQALTRCLQEQGHTASCYTCGEAGEGLGAAFVAELADQHLVRFRVSECGINWLESRNGHELVKLEGAEAIEELQRIADVLRRPLSSRLPNAAHRKAEAS
jgi:hypothetical protein